MLFRFSETVMGAAVAACTCSTVNSGLISVMSRPLSVTSSTHISVMIFVDAVGSGQGQTALLEDLGVALGGVLHADDAVLSTHAQVHSAAHAGHLLAGDDPVGQIALGIHLQSAQEAGVHMAAADQAEIGSGIDKAAAVSHGSNAATGIDDVVGIIVGVALFGG